MEDFVKNLLLQDLGKKAFWPQNNYQGTCPLSFFDKQDLKRLKSYFEISGNNTIAKSLKLSLISKIPLTAWLAHIVQMTPAA